MCATLGGIKADGAMSPKLEFDTTSTRMVKIVCSLFAFSRACNLFCASYFEVEQFSNFTFFVQLQVNFKV